MNSTTTEPPVRFKAKSALVCGAGGGIGQPISMLLKLSPLIGELRLYDVVRTLGVGADLGPIDSAVHATTPTGAFALHIGGAAP